MHAKTFRFAIYSLPPLHTERSIDRDFWMDAKEATEFGLLDEVVAKKPLLTLSGGSGDMSPPK